MPKFAANLSMLFTELPFPNALPPLPGRDLKPLSFFSL